MRRIILIGEGFSDAIVMESVVLVEEAGCSNMEWKLKLHGRELIWERGSL